MLFCGLNNSIALDVVRYQFPDSPKSLKDDFNYDSNWLVVSVCYTENGRPHTQEDACLLTYELSEVYDELCKLKDGQTGSYISDFMEPYLRIVVLKNEDQYSIAVHYVFDTTDGIWKTWKVNSTVTANEYTLLLDEFKMLVDKYPQK